jgi:hypothetical protein
LITILFCLEFRTFQVPENIAVVIVVEEQVLGVEFAVAVLAIVVGVWWCLGGGRWIIVGTELFVSGVLLLGSPLC